MSIHSRALSAFTAALPARAPVQRTADGVRVGELDVELLWAGQGWPSQVRQILATPSANKRHRVVVAERMGESAQTVAEHAGAGWVDETGAAGIAFPTLVIARHRRLAPTASGSWTRATLTVVEALLAHGAPATVSAVGVLTGLAQRTCAIALRLLTDQGLLSARAERGRGSGRVIERPGDLLDTYCREYAALRPTLEISVGVAVQDLDEQLLALGSTLERVGYTWGLTGLSAAQVYAPFMTSVGRATILVNADTPAALDDVVRRSGLTALDGGRLIVRPFVSRTKNDLCRVVDGVRLAPWPSVVADAREEGVRGEDAADHLRSTMLDAND